MQSVRIVGVRGRARREGAALLCLTLAVSLAAACGGSNIVSLRSDERNRAVSVALGDELDIELGNVGPGQFASPPMFSASTLRFLGDSIVPPYLPSGPTQRFRFQAMARGVTVIVFQHTGLSSFAVEDTVTVR